MPQQQLLANLGGLFHSLLDTRPKGLPGQGLQGMHRSMDRCVYLIVASLDASIFVRRVPAMHKNAVTYLVASCHHLVTKLGIDGIISPRCKPFLEPGRCRLPCGCDLA